ncbi:MAG: hypothetical protein LAT81_07780 [Oceanicaulis sp.]|nr:hypothetical protein [Oceanicaulis sp.]
MSISNVNTIYAYHSVWENFACGYIDISSDYYYRRIYLIARGAGINNSDFSQSCDSSHISLDVRAMANDLIINASAHRERWAHMLKYIYENKILVGHMFGVKLADLFAPGDIDPLWVRDELKRTYTAAVARCVIHILRGGQVKSRCQAEFYSLSGCRNHREAGHSYLFDDGLWEEMQDMMHHRSQARSVTHWAA